MPVLKFMLYILLALLSGCNDEGEKFSVHDFCKSIEDYRQANPSYTLKYPLAELDEFKFEECLEYRVIVTTDSGDNRPLYSGKILSVIKFDDSLKVDIEIEKYSSDKSICGTKKLISFDNLHEGTFYTRDDKKYAGFQALKGCQV